MTRKEDLLERSEEDEYIVSGSFLKKIDAHLQNPIPAEMSALKAYRKQNYELLSKSKRAQQFSLDWDLVKALQVVVIPALVERKDELNKAYYRLGGARNPPPTPRTEGSIRSLRRAGWADEDISTGG